MLRTRQGQSLTSTIVGVAIMGLVGTAAGRLAHNQWEQENVIKTNADVANLMEAKVNEIRTGTPFFSTTEGYDEKTFPGDAAREIKTSATPVCNSNGRCDAMDVTVKVIDKTTGEVLMQETIKKVYTHYEEKVKFASNGSATLPSDAIGFTYVAEGVHGGGHEFFL